MEGPASSSRPRTERARLGGRLACCACMCQRHSCARAATLGHLSPRRCGQALGGHDRSQTQWRALAL
eukprot:5247837-Pyramimonas_sp.AAC.1